MDIKDFIRRHYGKLPGENVVDYFERIMAGTHPADHTFRESSEFPGACVCGWIGLYTTCSDCGKNARRHIEAYVGVVGTLAMLSTLDILSQLGFSGHKSGSSHLDIDPPRPTDYMN